MLTISIFPSLLFQKSPFTLTFYVKVCIKEYCLHLHEERTIFPTIFVHFWSRSAIIKLNASTKPQALYYDFPISSSIIVPTYHKFSDICIWISILGWCLPVCQLILGWFFFCPSSSWCLPVGGIVFTVVASCEPSPSFFQIGGKYFGGGGKTTAVGEQCGATRQDLQKINRFCIFTLTCGAL